MIKIYTPLKTGQFIHPRVLRGVADNGAALVPITGWSGLPGDALDRACIISNWKEAMELFAGDILLGMDSDIELPGGVVDDIVKGLDKFFFVHANTDANYGHGIWGARRSIIEQVAFTVSSSSCPICQWMKRIETYGATIGKIDKRVTEVSRT